MSNKQQSALSRLETALFSPKPQTTVSMATGDSDTKKSDTKDTRALKEVIHTTPFHILFDGSPSVQTTSLSLAEVASNATTKYTLAYDVPLASIRAQA
ncbi:hypothetical protein DL771_001605 [Monosporascus sp. 5C6A]|nr:hypothetical protein DL771_001605 [Monosporascus sp. 5C6A]